MQKHHDHKTRQREEQTHQDCAQHHHDHLHEHCQTHHHDHLGCPQHHEDAQGVCGNHARQKTECSSEKSCEKAPCHTHDECCHHRMHAPLLGCCHQSTSCCQKNTQCYPNTCCPISNCYAKYQPLFVLLLVSYAFTRVDHAAVTNAAMYDFMGYLLVLLGMLKLFNLRKFIDRFATYDLITSRFRIYGFFYPFIELGLGLSYLFDYSLILTNQITLGLMLLTGIGVINGLVSRQDLKCACVGGLLNIPLGGLSLIENFGTAAMAGYLLYFGV